MFMKQFLQWKNNNYYTFLSTRVYVCVCGYVGARVRKCACARVALLIQHAPRRHIVIAISLAPPYFSKLSNK